jgi:branched-chain amino acid transport system ATP-binding protein
LTVKQNLTLGAYTKKSPEHREATLKNIFKLFPILENRKNQRAGTLSGGEQQMLAIARALISNPIFLLMDEPTEGLAPVLVREVGDVILRLKGGGLSIFLVEQNLSFARKFADYTHVMSKGKIVHSSTPAELWENQGIKERYLGV